MNNKKITLVFLFLRIGGLENLLLVTFKKFIQKKYDAQIITLYVDSNLTETLKPYQANILAPAYPINNLMKSISLRYIFGIPIMLILILKSINSSKIIAFGNICFYLCCIVKLFNKDIKIYYYETDIKYPKKKILPTLNLYQYFVQLFNYVFQDFLDYIFIKNAEKIIVIDDLNFSFAKRQYSHFKKIIIKIYPPITSNQIKLISNKVLPNIKKIFRNQNYKFLSVVGNLDYKKNTIDSIRLIDFLKKKAKKFKLIIVGDGEMRKFLEKETIKRNLTDDVYFVGKVNNDELNYIYSKIYCNLFFAKNQTWGLTPFEALKHKKPSIISSESGCARYLKSKKMAKIVQLDNFFLPSLYFLEKVVPFKKFTLKKMIEMKSDFYIKKVINILN